MAPFPAGYAVRNPSSDDAVGLAELLRADDLAEVGESTLDVGFVRDQWSNPGLDLAADAWIVTATDDAIVGYAHGLPEGDAKIRSWFVVHPGHRGLGIAATLLGRIEARAAERLRGVPSGVLHIAIADADDAAAALVRGRGFERVHTFLHLQIDLAAPFDPGEPPTGIRIVGIDPDRDLPRIHSIFVEAFRNEWGYRVIGFDEWLETEVETPSYDPTLWLLASDGEEPVGALSGVAWSDRGWVGELGVREAWRGRGIASALLRRSFATFAERGLGRVMLNVDATNTTGAVRLYERVGMRKARGWDVYEKRVS
jgi:mycothiol synthase